MQYFDILPSRRFVNHPKANQKKHDKKWNKTQLFRQKFNFPTIVLFLKITSPTHNVHMTRHDPHLWFMGPFITPAASVVSAALLA